MVRVVTPPAVEPVTINDFKGWMQGLTITPEQELMVLSLLKAGREEAEKYQNAAYCEQTLQIAPDSLDGPIVLPRPPFKELLSVTAYLVDGTEQDLTELCEVDDISRPAVLYVYAAPQGLLRTVNPVLVTYKAGSDTVPERVKQAILLYATWSWMHRAGDEPIPDAFYNLLRKGRVIPV